MNGGGQVAASMFEITLCRPLTYISFPSRDKFWKVDLYVAKGTIAVFFQHVFSIFSLVHFTII